MSEEQTLYQQIKAAGLQIDHHESDLYVKDTPEARDILNKYRFPGTNNRVGFESFKSEIDGALWLDVPFMYDPWWDKKPTQLRHRSNKV